MKTAPTKRPLPHGRRHRVVAFTILEMLAVLLILAILFTITGSVVGTIQRKAQQNRAAADANALVQAVLHYRQVYGCWPCEPTNAPPPYISEIGHEFGKTNLLSKGSPVEQAEILAALFPNSPRNPRGILFLTVATNAVIQGRLTDPWQHPYLLVMDAQQPVSSIGPDLAFSNLAAYAISAGPPVATPSASNWIFSAGVRP